MIARIRKSIDEKDQGFTLIELLVVIIIIGILAAIAIPVFLNQRKKAVDASIKSDLRTVANEMETYYTDSQLYPTVLTASNGTSVPNTTTIGTTAVTLSQGNVVSVTMNGTLDAYCIRGTNAKGSNSTGFFYISSKGGLQPNTVGSCTF